MPLTKGFADWTQSLAEARQEGFREGLQDRFREGEQIGLNRGLREGVRVVLEIKFGALGLLFWQTHLEAQDSDGWREVFEAVKSAEHLDHLSRFKRR